MAAPPPTNYTVSYSFTAYEQANPSLPKPGAYLDTEFANLVTSVNSAIAALQDIRRSDGKLSNAIVTMDSLAPSVAALLGKANPRGNWATATAYAVGDLVRRTDTGGTYICAAAHTSGTMTTDITAGKWIVLTTFDAGNSAAVPPAGAPDVGKTLLVTGANTYAWGAASAIGLGNGTAGAPTISWAADATSGFYAPGASQIGLALAGAAAYTFTVSTFTMAGNRMVLGKDGNGQAWLQAAGADTDWNRSAFGYSSTGSGLILVANMRANGVTMTWDGDTLTAPDGNGRSVSLSSSTDTIRITSLAGETSGIDLRDQTATNYSWRMQYNPANTQLQFVPRASTYNVAFLGTWVFAGTQTSLPGSLTNGLAAYDLYVQDKLALGTSGAINTTLNQDGTAAFGGAVTAPAGTAGNQVVNFSQFPSLKTATETSVTLPGGIIRKSGRGTSAGNVATITFTAAFPTACVACVVTPLNNTGAARGAKTTSISAASVAVNTEAAAIDFTWIAEGY